MVVELDHATVPNGYYTLTSLASNSGGYAFRPGIDINVDN